MLSSELTIGCNLSLVCIVNCVSGKMSWMSHRNWANSVFVITESWVPLSTGSTVSSPSSSSTYCTLTFFNSIVTSLYVLYWIWPSCYFVVFNFIGSAFVFVFALLQYHSNSALSLTSLRNPEFHYQRDQLYHHQALLPQGMSWPRYQCQFIPTAFRWFTFSGVFSQGYVSWSLSSSSFE